MIFEVHIPAYPLNQFIESFIYYRDYNPVHSVDRFLPDGNINVVIDLTDYPKYIYAVYLFKTFSYIAIHSSGVILEASSPINSNGISSGFL